MLAAQGIHSAPGHEPLGRAGTLPLHQELDDMVAGFVRKEAALVFGMGFATNSLVMPALVGPGCLVISDALNHASIVAGCRGSGAKVKVLGLPHRTMLQLPFEAGLPLSLVIGRQGLYMYMHAACALAWGALAACLLILLQQGQALGRRHSCRPSRSGSLQRARAQVFKHNSAESLEAVLRKNIAEGQPRSGRAWRKILVITEGIFSMEGEVSELAALVAVCKKYRVGDPVCWLRHCALGRGDLCSGKYACACFLGWMPAHLNCMQWPVVSDMLLGHSGSFQQHI